MVSDNKGNVLTALVPSCAAAAHRDQAPELRVLQQRGCAAARGRVGALRCVGRQARGQVPAQLAHHQLQQQQLAAQPAPLCDAPFYNQV